jgi:hypothetical protein
MKFKDGAVSLHAMGYQVIPVRGKRPTLDEWQKIEITDERVAHWAANGQADFNIGIRTGQGSMAIYAADIDFYDPAVASRIRKAFWARFGSGPLRVGQKPKSLTVYQGEPGRKKINSPVFISPDGVEHKFELLGDGQQFVAYGIHPDTGLDYVWPAEQKLIDVEAWELNTIDHDEVMVWVRDVLPSLVPSDWQIKGQATGGGNTTGSNDVLDNIKPRLDITNDELAEYVECLDPEGDYDNWMTMMFGVHHQTGGSDEGWQIVLTQSRRSSKYKAANTEYKWSKIKSDSRSNQITAASIIHLARQTDTWKQKEATAKREVSEGWEQRVKDVQDTEALEQLCGNIATDQSLSVTGKVRLEAALIARFDELGVRLTKRALQDIFKAAINHKRRQLIRSSTNRNGAAGTWAEPYVWSTFDDKFIHCGTQEKLSVMSFNALHGRDVRGVWVDANGNPMRASEVALQEMQVPVVHRQMYVPYLADRFTIDGLDYINSYRPDLVPDSKPEGEWTEEDHTAIATIKKHIEMLCCESASYVVQWMAHNVQHPGVKIRHSPLIKGIQGDGKNLIAETLARVIGAANVIYVSPKVVLSDFNGWAEGHCVAVLDEIRAPGHNRHDGANAIKPVISNDQIAIHRKGVDQYNIINTTNPLALTNYADAIPIEDADRRWHIIFSPFSCPKSLGDVMGAAYFEGVFSAIRNHVAAVRGWLLTTDLKTFNRNGRAPDSSAKKAMIAAGKSDLESIIEAIISEGKTVGVSADIISTRHLKTAILLMDDEVVISASELSRVYHRLNYMKDPTQIFWQGQNTWVWVRDHKTIGNKEVHRSALRATLPADERSDDVDTPF